MKPELLDKTTKMLLEILPSEKLDEVRNITQENLIDLHFELGLWIRNNILNEHSIILNEFIDSGVIHKDTMSHIMVEALHEHLTSTNSQTCQ